MQDKPEFFRLALKGRALTYYRVINATQLKWDEVIKKFRENFNSVPKQSEITAELDLMTVDQIRDDGDSDRQALGKYIARLDKLSMMG